MLAAHEQQSELVTEQQRAACEVRADVICHHPCLLACNQLMKKRAKER
jgi:hypothetical protein